MTLLLYLCECKLGRDKTFLFGMGERIRSYVEAVRAYFRPMRYENKKRKREEGLFGLRSRDLYVETKKDGSEKIDYL
ncbi:hypothetical protein [Bacillus cereus group sp. BfR-BA-01315]|uniref:hypothetical protein n=1 Tax=Bacillus cereus group sp. BfR-BA-01315 TaxID=2920292 RepID=UPI001F599FD1|nr:hypothetical protein [Bacillus cereus group sp. BfR-BA-01315]